MLRIVDGGLDDPCVIALLQAHHDLMHSISPPESCHVLDVSGLKTPEVTFWSAWDGEMLQGVGALKRLDQSHGEVKSMHTVATTRGRGTGTALLNHIIAFARTLGLKRLSLETGSVAEFAPARRLYLRHGFRPCGPFGYYLLDPKSTFMTRKL